MSSLIMNIHLKNFSKIYLIVCTKLNHLKNINRW